MRPSTLDRKDLSSHTKPYEHTRLSQVLSYYSHTYTLASPSTQNCQRNSNERGLERTRACRAEPGVRPVRTFDQPGREPVLLAYSHLQKGGDPAAGSPTATLLRLRPSHQARLRPLPPLRVGSRTSGAPNFHGVTGGVYKARERIHRGVADPRLLAIPTSCSRVTDCNPNLDRVFPIGSTSRYRNGLSRPL